MVTFIFIEFQYPLYVLHIRYVDMFDKSKCSQINAPWFFFFIISEHILLLDWFKHPGINAQQTLSYCNSFLIPSFRRSTLSLRNVKSFPFSLHSRRLAKAWTKREVQFLKASIESSTCLVSMACKCKHKLLCRCVSMWALIGPAFPLTVLSFSFVVARKMKLLLY